MNPRRLLLAKLNVYTLLSDFLTAAKKAVTENSICKLSAHRLTPVNRWKTPLSTKVFGSGKFRSAFCWHSDNQSIDISVSISWPTACRSVAVLQFIPRKFFTRDAFRASAVYVWSMMIQFVCQLITSHILLKWQNRSNLFYYHIDCTLSGLCGLYHPISALKLAQNSRSSSIFYVFRRITSFDILAQRSIFCLMSRGVWLICNTWLSLSQTTTIIARASHYFCCFISFLSCLFMSVCPSVSLRLSLFLWVFKLI